MATKMLFDLTTSGYTSIKRTINADENRLLTSIFHDCDTDKKGFLSREDLKFAVVSLFGYKPSKYETNEILQTHGDIIIDGKKGISLTSFLAVLGPKFASRDEDDEIRQVFLAFDIQCHGFLTVEDLMKVFGQIAPRIPAHTVAASFRELDRDGDGRISYKDFEFMMKYGTDS
ncbi:EF-hand calcium-binding domain-containing protein 11-like isoform X1 [Gigantopelta aegis]|uniref:EF-hand calcium-binding domain-containing protein 11-like isoform X1 n=1 Tax=Gigantopelta aegis TaxID=1735272 RepID=UPI001B888B34|nr:EF-hand calcium-binding domain-containing protein 11-like isoform X1 [Gigantopelta aegis]